MELVTYDKYNKYNIFSMPMTYYEGNGFDNESALGERFCFILIEKGSGIINLNGKNISFISPVLFCINEKEHIRINNINTKVKAIYFHPSIINSALDFKLIREISADLPVTLKQDADMNNFFINHDDKFIGKISIGPVSFKKFDSLCNQLNIELTKQNRENWPCRSRSYIMEVLFLIENVYIKNDLLEEFVMEEYDENIKCILVYLFNNYNKKITISDLTKEFNINRTTLSKKFSDYVGESIVTYLNKLRITMAAIILRDTKLPITEIMERVGFSDSTHFLRTFKKYMSLTPKEYREKYCWM